MLADEVLRKTPIYFEVDKTFLVISLIFIFFCTISGMYILEAQKKFSHILEVAIYLIEDPNILICIRRNFSDADEEIFQMKTKKFFRCRRRSFTDAKFFRRRNSLNAKFFRRKNFSDAEFRMKNNS